jgi:hypothetical protein
MAAGLSLVRFSFLDRSTAVSHTNPTTAGCIVAMITPFMDKYYFKIDQPTIVLAVRIYIIYFQSLASISGVALRPRTRKREERLYP